MAVLTANRHTFCAPTMKTELHNTISVLLGCSPKSIFHHLPSSLSLKCIILDDRTSISLDVFDNYSSRYRFVLHNVPYFLCSTKSLFLWCFLLEETAEQELFNEIEFSWSFALPPTSSPFFSHSDWWTPLFLSNILHPRYWSSECDQSQR